MGTLENVSGIFLGEVTRDITVYDEIFEIMEQCNVDFLNFNDEDLEKILYEFHSTSVKMLNRYLQHIREIIYVVNPNKKISSKSMYDYIDYKELEKKTIIFPYHYQHIKNQLTIDFDNDTYNYRDRVVFCLACHGLTKSELKNLKKDDVVFVSEDKVEICLPTRVVPIKDKDLIQDIKNCIKEIQYCRIEKTGKVSFVDYMDSPYLIRPKNTNARRKKQTIFSPSLLLKAVLTKIGDEVTKDIDMEHLSIGDLSRSYMFYVLAKNGYNLQAEDIQCIIKNITEDEIFWRIKVAQRIYRD